MWLSRLAYFRALFIGIVIAVSGNVHATAPRIFIDSATKGFGQVEQGAVVKKHYVLKNLGDAPLRIRSVQFSMPGMNIRVKQEIAPGESVTAEISWNTVGYSREVKGQALLFLNDPETPQLLLTLAGIIQAPIDVLPIPAYYISQFQGEQKVSHLTVKNNQARTLNITEIERKGTHFDAKLLTNVPGKAFDLQVTVPPQTPVGRYRESLVLHTDNPDRPKVGVEVNILVKPDVYVMPDAAEFGSLSLSKVLRHTSAAELIKQTFTIRRRQGDMSITNIETDIPFLRVDATPAGPAEGFYMEAWVDFEQAVLGPFSGKIILTTDDSSFPQIEVPVSGRVSR